MWSSSRRAVLVSAALAVLIAVIYWPVLRSGFVNYDDPEYVTDNRMVQRGISVEGFQWAFGKLHGKHTYWHPLSWVSHMLDCQLFGLRPGWHHAMNVLFHILNSILVLLVLNNLTGGFWRSAVVAAFFAVHPLQVETVAWVTERKNLLSTLFWLLATAAYVRFARTKRARPYVVCLILFTCGLMSKPAVVTLPFVFLLLDFWPLNRISMTAAWSERTRAAVMLLLEKLPFIALSAVSAGITLLAHERLGSTSHGLRLIYRIQNAAVSYAQYLKKMFLPFDLAVIYPHPGVWPAQTVVIASVVLVIITGIVLAYWKKRPYLAVGWFWFVGVLVPAIGIIQAGSQSMADRFVYVPILGVLIIIAWGAADALITLRPKAAAAGAVFAAALVYLSMVTASQVRHWKDSEALFRRALGVTQGNFVANFNLAMALFEKGKRDEAEFYARQATEIDPRDGGPLVVLGSIHKARNEFPAAISNYSRFLTVAQGDFLKADAHGSLGEIFSAEKNAAAAIEQYRQALKLNPDWPMVLNNLAWLLATNPDAQLRDGPEAVRLAEHACELSRNEVPMYIGTLAAAYAEAGRFAEAVATAERARALAQEKRLPKLAERNAALLKLYEAEKPVREPL